MIIDWEKVEIYVKPGPTDLRKQINGLSIMVESEMEKPVFSGNLFMFCNRERRLIKVLYWDKTGFCMLQKRLEKERFPWPVTEEQATCISLDKFKMLLAGIDFWKAHEELKYKKIM